MIKLSSIQNKLIEAIKNSGMTQTFLAKELGIKQQTISHYVRGDILPSLDTFANLCVLLKVDPADILCTREAD